MEKNRNLRWESMNKGIIELPQLIRHFESFNRSERKSPRTIEWYTYVLEFFYHWLKEAGLPTQLQGIGEAEVREHPELLYCLYLGYSRFLRLLGAKEPDYQACYDY